MSVRTLLILGSGPAGYTAGIYAARAGLKPLLLEGPQPGGQLMLTTEVENFPGFPEGILGPELMQRMRAQAERFGCEVVSAEATQVNLRETPFRIRTSSEEYRAHAVIIATGARARMLGLPEEEVLLGHGLSTCAVCDGFFFREKRVAVVGGGDSAMEDALYLANLAKEVIVIHRRDRLRASKIMQERAFQNPKIQFKWNRVVRRILDPEQQRVTGLILQDTQNGNTEELPVDGVFLAIGHIPNTDLFRGQLELDDRGYIRVQPFSTVTSIPGVFACGDAVDFVYRQAVTAAGTGCMAALDAERYLQEKGLA